MKKILSIVLIFVMTVTMLSGMSTISSAFQVSASLNPNTGEVTVQGSIDSGAGQWVTVTVISPNQSIDYINQTRSGPNGSYEFRYITGQAEEGEYLVRVHDSKADSSKTTTFSYSSGNHESNEDDDEDDDDDSKPKPKPGVDSVLQKVRDIVSQLDNANSSLEDMLARTRGLIRSAAALNSSEKKQISEELASLAARIINKAGQVAQSDLLMNDSGSNLSVKLSKELISSKIAKMSEIMNALSQSFRDAGLADTAISGSSLGIQLDKSILQGRKADIGLPAEALNELAAKGIGLSMQLGDVTMNIPSGAIDTTQLSPSESNPEIEFSFMELDEEQVNRYSNDLNASARENSRLKLAGRVYEFNAEIVQGGTKNKIQNFNKDVTVELSYAGISVNEDKLGVYRYNPVTGGWEYAGGKVDKASGRIRFSTGHFSSYAAMEYFRTFADIKGHKSREAIEMLASKHIAFGYNDLFEPDKHVTRVEFIAFVIRALELDMKPYQNGYSDVKADAWYKDYVQTVVEAGIAVGHDGKFSPLEIISREQMAAIIMRAYRYAGYETPDATGELMFADKGNISGWALQDLAAAVKLGFIEGVDASHIMPQGRSTRADAAEIITNLLKAQ